MALDGATVAVRLGFVPDSLAIADPDHPGLRRAGLRAGAPYGGEGIERHLCEATDSCAEGATQPDLLTFGFDTVDLVGFADLQAALARVQAAGAVIDDDATAIRGALAGAVLCCAGGPTLTVVHVADEGLIMRTAGPDGMSLVGPQSVGMNEHGPATSVHADQDVFGTPLTQLMEGRAPSLLRHDSPDGANLDAGLMLVNLWIPLHQVSQPLVLADGRSIDRRRHQLRYGLATRSFLERDDDMAINDIWTFLHDPSQRWYLRSAMDHRRAYVFNTLSTAHGAGTLPGEDAAAALHRELEDAEAAVAAGDAAALGDALSDAPPSLPDGAPPALRDALATMRAVADEARRDPETTCGARAEAWLEASRAARAGVVRTSIELRLVVSLTE